MHKPVADAPVPESAPTETSQPVGHRFRHALGLLTILPGPRPDPHGPAFARASVFFPVVGLLLGGILAGTNALLAPRLPRWATPVCLLALWEFATRRTTVAAARTEPEQTATARPTSVAAARLLSAGLALNVLELGLIGSLASAASVALLFAPLLGAWGIVVVAVGARDADRPSTKFNPSVSFEPFAWTSVASAVAVFFLADAAGVLVFVCTGGFLVALRPILHRWAGGVSWPTLRFASRLVEVLVLALFTFL